MYILILRRPIISFYMYRSEEAYINVKHGQINYASKNMT